MTLTHICNSLKRLQDQPKVLKQYNIKSVRAVIRKRYYNWRPFTSKTLQFTDQYMNKIYSIFNPFMTEAVIM